MQVSYCGGGHSHEKKLWVPRGQTRVKWHKQLGMAEKRYNQYRQKLRNVKKKIAKRLKKKVRMNQNSKITNNRPIKTQKR